tara:strand:- start:1395 stop:1508 length:114 start_codon:yes stop_codon:yes gene_type:complete
MDNNNFYNFADNNDSANDEKNLFGGNEFDDLEKEFEN